MITADDIINILSKYYKAHSSLFLTRELNSKKLYFYNFSCPNSIKELVSIMNTLESKNETDINSLFANLSDKNLSPYSCDDYMVKITEKQGRTSHYISVSFHGIKGVVVKKSYGNKFEAKLDYFEKSFYNIQINTTNGDMFHNGKFDCFYKTNFGGYLSRLLLRDEKFCNCFKDILLLCCNNCYAIKDLVRTIDEDGFVAMPVKVFDAKKYHNKDEMIRGFTGSDLNINFNKISLNHGYLLSQLSQEIPENQLGYLCRLNGQSIVEIMREVLLEKWKIESFAGEFIKRYYMRKLNADGRMVEDYYKMCHEQGQSVSLKFQTLNRLIKEHDKLARRYEKEKLAEEFEKPLIAKGTKFLKLRSKLPEEFEWLNTTEKLFYEGKKQHNCVFFYRDKIRRDESTIYHWENRGVSYTIEFVRDYGGKYKVAQMMQRYNRAAIPEDEEYVQGLVSV